ncbi:ribonuclease H [uncultured Bifidobacterium sp.]|uniref:ribonuclease H family protein n=1 Tax=uncultured Bifidobacterium sp. TaxID=165187 RepID=UPI00261231E4|nr:ribonuclease H [uncultured Bifidobacterium sp.]
MTITVSTDGSALANPHGPMGWAWADHQRSENDSGHNHPSNHDAGGATNGTNQIGELCAVLEALRAHPGNEPLIIETDSQYAINCSTTWVKGWKRNGWRNKQGKPVKNDALIKAIDAEISRRPGTVRFTWVKGHAGNAGNEMVDDLARTFASDCRDGSRDGYLPKEGWQALMSSDYAKGLSIPSDARMLLDGSITTHDYHLGRVDDTASDPEDRPSPNPPATENDARDAGMTGIADTTDTDSNNDTTDVDDPADMSDVDASHDMPSAAEQSARLTVSGRLRFSPPPQSSPSFDGRPRRIHGIVRIDGLVQGDGTMIVENEPFVISVTTP